MQAPASSFVRSIATVPTVETGAVAAIPLRLRLLPLGLAALLLAGPAFAEDAPSATPDSAPVDVSVVKAEEIDWQEKITSIGVAEARQGVDVSGPESGVVSEILFDSGERVQAGQPLVHLDTRKEQADLDATMVQIPTAKADLQRKLTLVKERIVSQTEVDEAQSRCDSLNAESISLRATIARRQISAPFSGILGIRKVNKGQYLNPGDLVVSLQDLSVMRMRFLVTQRDFAKIKIGQEIEARYDAYPGEVFKGTVAAIEPSVRYQSGIIPIQAEVPNAGEKLLPGMYASLDVLLPDHSKRIVVPVSAVNANLYGETVYAIDEATMTARQVTVRTGTRRDNAVVIEEGLKPGEQVVVSGQLKLSNGAKVNIVQ